MLVDLQIISKGCANFQLEKIDNNYTKDIYINNGKCKNPFMLVWKLNKLGTERLA
jgi:hypothetical protein